ncbi:MAG TPA: riboflavin kinase [Spirochaetota bacterium]|nr:riboflavin kinase [Spirochaetota bacterium]
MMRIRDFDEWHRMRPKRVVYTVGNFDGVHLGHQRLIEVLLGMARECGAVPVVVTFTGHPQQLEKKMDMPFLLTTSQARAELLSSFGIEVVFEPVFSEHLAAMEPETFLERLAGEGSVGFVVGDDFRFGAARRGGVEDVAGFLERTGNGRLAIVPGLQMDGDRISSTRIRSALARGDVALAARYLGREYRMDGTRKPGDRIGSSIGFPTVNLHGMETMLPANGVYLGSLQSAGLRYDAMLYIGVRPSVGGSEQRVEAHVLHAAPEIPPGASVSVSFRDRLRDEAVFADREALRAQLERDREEAKARLVASR